MLPTKFIYHYPKSDFDLDDEIRGIFLSYSPIMLNSKPYEDDFLYLPKLDATAVFEDDSDNSLSKKLTIFGEYFMLTDLSLDISRTIANARNK